MTLDTVGRIVSTSAAIGTLVMWGMYLFAHPTAASAQGRILTFGALMMFSAVVSAAAAALGAHLGMYLLFFVSFFPVGLVTMSGPGRFSAIGWLNLAYLAGAALVHYATRQARTRATPRDAD